MLTTGQIFGFLFLFVIGPLALAGFVVNYGLHHPTSGLGKWVYRWWPFKMPKSVARKLEEQQETDRQALREAATPASKENQLLTLVVDNVLTVLSRKLGVRGVLTILTLKTYTGKATDFTHIDRDTSLPLPELRWITLDGSEIIAQLYDKESGTLVWLMGEEVSSRAEAPPTEYLKPFGKAFAATLQGAEGGPVDFKYPGFEGKTWRCQDIIWGDCRSQGHNRFGSSQQPYTRVQMLLSQNVRTSDYLLFVQVRGGQGNNGLYLLHEFNPEVVIEDVL